MMIIVSLMATSCYYDEMPPEAVIPIPDVVSYSKDIQPLWNESCVSCHMPGTTAPDLSTANSYLALTTNNKYVIPGNTMIFISLGLSSPRKNLSTYMIVSWMMLSSMATGTAA